MIKYIFTELVTFDGHRLFPMKRFNGAGDLVGPGHQDVLAFAMAASALLDYQDGEDIYVDPTDVHHCWVAITDEGFYELLKERTEKAVPVTVVRP